MEIKTNNKRNRFAVSDGEDREHGYESVVFLIVPDRKLPDHEHFEIDRMEAIKLRNWLNKFINGEELD